MENPVYGKYCFTAGDQEGVLDGLLEALQSGSAFAKYFNVLKDHV
jgi:hypothetical protein